jgi:fused signal recognition particle receptor
VSDKPQKRGFFAAFRRVFTREEREEAPAPEPAEPSRVEREPAPQPDQGPDAPVGVATAGTTLADASISPAEAFSAPPEVHAPERGPPESGPPEIRPPEIRPLEIEPALSQPPAAPQPSAPEPLPPPEASPKRPSWFQRLRQGLAKTSTQLAQNIAGVFTKRKLDAETLGELEDLLIQSDLGVETSARITEALAKGRHDKEITTEEVRAVLAAEVERVLVPVAKPLLIPRGEGVQVVLVVGVNGTGKTTTIGKLAHSLIGQGSSVMIAAGDTFRAAAIDQLKVWGERTGAEVIARKVGADAAGLAYDALTQAREKNCDVLLIDTAGRLQNKQALMDELEVFKDKAGVTGLIMTKLDGTARGGILVAISAKFGLPVHAIGVGESVDDLSEFDAAEFARAIALG